MEIVVLWFQVVFYPVLLIVVSYLLIKCIKACVYAFVCVCVSKLELSYQLFTLWIALPFHYTLKSSWLIAQSFSVAIIIHASPY